MPQRSSWLAAQMLIYQHLTDLAILAEFFLNLFILQLLLNASNNNHLVSV